MKHTPDIIRSSADIILKTLADPGYIPGGRADLVVTTKAEVVAGAVVDIYTNLDEIGKCLKAHFAGKPGQVDGIEDAMKKLGYDFS